MRGIFWLRAKAGRLLVSLVALLVYVALLVTDAGHSLFSSLSLWLTYGFSSFVALIFLAVGIFVWLYARERLIAGVLFCFSCAAMILFSVQTAAVSGDQLFSAISGVSSALVLALCALLLLVFPRNYLFSQDEESGRVRLYSPGFDRHLIALGYACGVIFFCLMAIGCLIASYIQHAAPPWLNTFAYSYDAVIITGILITIVVSYRQATLRERQQLRFLVSGVVLALLPLLALTVIPQALRLPDQYILDAQLSTLSVILLPLSLGYSILRYQILVFDTYVRRAITWIIGCIFLAVLSYLIVACINLFLTSTISPEVIGVAILSIVLAPCVWWLAKVITEKLFFGEIRYYRSMIEKPGVPLDRALNVDEVSRLMTLAAVHAFETPQICLFVLEEGSGYYRICPPLREDSGDEARRHFALKVLQKLSRSNCDERSGLDRQLPVMERISQSFRPVLLGEVTEEDAASFGLSHYIGGESSFGGHDVLLAPVRAQGKMIGLLVLGARSNRRPYAGPDLEIVQLIQARFSSLLETARVYARTSQHAALLNSLYSASVMSEAAFQTLEEIAVVYAQVAADAVKARAEIWLYNETKYRLRRSVAIGSGPLLFADEHIQFSQEHEWFPEFYESGEQMEEAGLRQPRILSYLQSMPSFPFAWLPLKKSEQFMGVLILTYPESHFFMKEEMRVLEMFANQCAASLENAMITMELRIAYERQKELDRLKDQFIMTASHELRTPLTAVQGYIELLNDYNSSLSVDARASFIAKAHRGCDELALMVGNIMDASRVRIDVENVKLSPIVVLDSVTHVLEILEAITRREQRSVFVVIDPEICVMGDDMRLRQVLLNLVSNAFKYSPTGTSIEITSEVHETQVTICIRDHGAGVPLGDQPRLFERFVRLDRDMNSPVRGAGLGLYICKQLVEAMGGRIWVESSGRVGEGSTFAFTLNRGPLKSSDGRSKSMSELRSVVE